MDFLFPPLFYVLRLSIKPSKSENYEHGQKKDFLAYAFFQHSSFYVVHFENVDLA